MGSLPDGEPSGDVTTFSATSPLSVCSRNSCLGWRHSRVSAQNRPIRIFLISLDPCVLLFKLPSKEWSSSDSVLHLSTECTFIIQDSFSPKGALYLWVWQLSLTYLSTSFRASLWPKRSAWSLTLWHSLDCNSPEMEDVSPLDQSYFNSSSPRSISLVGAFWFKGIKYQSKLFFRGKVCVYATRWWAEDV